MKLMIRAGAPAPALSCGCRKRLEKPAPLRVPLRMLTQRGGDRYMCVKMEQLGLVLLGAGIGLLVSFALCGWFLRVLVAIILIVLGLLLLK